MWDLYYAVNQSLLNWLLSRGIVAVGMHFTGHCCCGKVASEERLKKLQIYGEKKYGHGRDMAISRGSTVLMTLVLFFLPIFTISSIN